MSLTQEMDAPAREKKSHLWDRHPDDFYIEPKWVSERLFQVEQFHGGIYDPACGSGRIIMSARMAGYADNAFGTDLVARSHWCSEARDFLTDPLGFDNIVCNPPFKHAERFVEVALANTASKVAMLLPSKWIHGDKRSRWLSDTPLRRVLFITPRPSMPPGPVIESGINPGGGKDDFAWFIWLRGFDGKPECGWLRKIP